MINKKITMKENFDLQSFKRRNDNANIHPAQVFAENHARDVFDKLLETGGRDAFDTSSIVTNFVQGLNAHPKNSFYIYKIGTRKKEVGLSIRRIAFSKYAEKKLPELLEIFEKRPPGSFTGEPWDLSSNGEHRISVTTKPIFELVSFTSTLTSSEHGAVALKVVERFLKEGRLPSLLKCTEHGNPCDSYDRGKL